MRVGKSGTIDFGNGKAFVVVYLPADKSSGKVNKAA